MWPTRTRTRTRPAAVWFARRSALHVLLLDDHHAMNEFNVFSLQSCEALNWFDVECKFIVSNGMLTCG